MRIRSYKVRAIQTASGRTVQYGIGLPKDIAQAIPPEASFVPEVTEGGVFYRLVVSQRPTWIKDAA